MLSVRDITKFRKRWLSFDLHRDLVNELTECEKFVRNSASKAGGREGWSQIDFRN